MAGNPITFPSDHFSLHELARGVYAAIATIGGAGIGNAAILDLGGRTLVFDTGMTPRAGRDLRLAAEQLTGRTPELVVNSHYHNDHIWGNQAFGPESLFISTAETLKLMQTLGVDQIQWARDVSPGRLADVSKQYAAATDESKRNDAKLW